MAAMEVCHNTHEKFTDIHLRNGGPLHTEVPTHTWEANENLPKKGILNFYRGTSLFVTGITGFVGKALLEKLLRTCTGVEKIYVLVRSKRGQDGSQRLKKILTSPVFNKMKQTNPGIFTKIQLVNGDCSHENLGLSRENRETLIDNVNIVFHAAASVRFNEPLRDAVLLNTYGTKTILDLCKSMKNLKSFVYISTAFSNSDKCDEEIKESVYKPEYDPEMIINCVQTFPSDVFNAIEAKVIAGHPNTYTFSKSLAETLVQNYSSSIPTAIVRPSIVTPSCEEPVPGWTDSMAGATGIVAEVGRGTVRSILCKGSNRTELIPVDILVNTLIAAAWHTHEKRSSTLRVYNCTNGKVNPLTWTEFSDYVEYYAKKYPSKYVTWYPSYQHTQNRYMHWFVQIFLQYLLAVILDFRNKFFSENKQGLMLMCYRKFVLLLDISAFFTLNEFNFAQDNLLELVDDVKKLPDGDLFKIGLARNDGLVWEDYMKDCTLGIRQYLLKDDMSSLPKAKSTLNRLYWLHNLLKVSTAYLLIKSVLWITGLNAWSNFQLLY